MALRTVKPSEHIWSINLQPTYPHFTNTSPVIRHLESISQACLSVDVKVTSIRQPQSSCPFRSASQKVFGLGYHLLIFIYDKVDNHERRTGRLNIQHTIFIDQSRTGDYQTTRGVLGILARDGNRDDLVAFLQERNLPLDDIGANALAERILQESPNLGFLTISNALQWRLQYGRVIQQAGVVDGIRRVR